ncbi:MAG: radical SAM protein [Halioglobus sp.]|nr:radical SAM protein [Halioglobus sp.]
MKIFALALAGSAAELPYLSLGMIIAYLRHWERGSLTDHYSIEPLILGGIEGTQPDSAIARAHNTEPAIYLFSSYVWNHALNLQAARTIKQVNPDAVIIMGGPEIPKYPEETEAFLLEHPIVDIAVLGEGEVSCAEIASSLSKTALRPSEQLRQVNGIVFRCAHQVIRTAERDRITDVNSLPSPYLTGEFDEWFLDMDYTVLETNRGCPYGCTYCDWGSATLQKVTRFSPDRVIEEIEYIASRRADKIFIADANFGMLEQDIEIALALVATRARTGFPKRLYTNFAKNGGRRLMQVIKILHEGGLLPTGIIALQTTDPATLTAIKRDNIKTSAYERMMEYFSAEGIPMASDIMIGLPGQTVESLQTDLQFCFDWKVSANGNYTSMMPNAPMAEKSYREEFGIEVDGNGLIASTSSFSRQDLHYMKALYLTYQFFVRLGVMKYYLYYLQIEHQVPALQLLRRWLDAVQAGDSDLPMSVRLYSDVFAVEKREGHWALLSWGEEAEFFFQDLEVFCEEMYAFTRREFQVELDASVLDTLINTQCAVTPRIGRKYPFLADMPHDVTRYFDQVKKVPSLFHLQREFKPLQAFPAAKLKIAPFVTRRSVKFMKLDGHSDDWEYRSALRFY